MFLDFAKGLFAQIMLHFAGVGGGHLRVYPQADKKVRKQAVAFIDALGHRLAGREQGDPPVPVHLHIAALPQLFHSHADTGLGEVELVCDIDGADHPMALLQTQNCFQIILCGFINFHKAASRCSGFSIH